MKKQTLLQDDFEQALIDSGHEIIEEIELPEGIGALFTPRLSAPSTTNKNWTHTSKGGYNQCIRINASTGSCLPNCVGYAWGRWRELLGKAPKLSRGNAEDWYGYKDGYSRGKTPKLGAVIVWRKGKVGNGRDGAGHVAIVEQIAPDGTVTFSNSNYSGTRFYLSKMKPPYHLGTAYAFLGFIYPPISYDGGSSGPVSKITLDGANSPTSIKRGQYFTIHGTIRSNLTMPRVEVGIVDSTGKKYVFHYDNKKVNAKSFNIHNADAAMMFRKLAKGTYYYRIWAWDKTGAHKVLDKKFKVV